MKEYYIVCANYLNDDFARELKEVASATSFALAQEKANKLNKENSEDNTLNGIDNYEVLRVEYE